MPAKLLTMRSHAIDPTFELPYFAPSHRLPAPLPSQAAIESSGKVLQEYTGRRVILYDDYYIIKYGANVSLTEGKNMLFVRETQAAPVPEVFALYSTTDEQGYTINYIIMEYITGHGLNTIWAHLDSSQKMKFSSQLHLYFEALRKLPTPGYFGCVGKQPFEQSMFWTAPEHDANGVVSGPFDTETELNNALVEKYLYNSGLNHKASYYRRVLPLVLQNHKSVFTHGDLQRKNIIVKDDGTVVVIDWETAGWYPEYWEYALAMLACGAWNDDWHESVQHVLAEYPNEYAWFDMLMRELWS